MRRRLGLCLTLAAIASCTATPYQEAGLTGGVTARKEADGTWLILGAGNGYTSVEALRDYTFLKAAETVLAEGQTCFEIVAQYAAMEEETMGSSYGTNVYEKPRARLRIRILENVSACEENNAETLVAELRPKVADGSAYPRPAN
jgi:hypothetical protein